jgi:hypothetical protein
MPNGWNFSEEAKLTNEQLGDELAKMTPLTVEEINKLFPRKADKEGLKELIQLVNSSASQNKKLASLTSNFAELGGVILTLLTKYLKRPNPREL